MPETALGLRFKVHIDGVGDLGYWSKCEGLTVEYEVFEYAEGGENSFVHRLPGRAKYQNIKLTRPIDSTSSKVASWVSSVGQKVRYRSGSVEVLDAAGETVASWDLSGVCPVRWTGPTLDVAASQVANEVLELAHAGFEFGG